MQNVNKNSEKNKIILNICNKYEWSKTIKQAQPAGGGISDFKLKQQAFF